MLFLIYDTNIEKLSRYNLNDKKEKDTLIKKYHKKTDSQLKEIALDLVNKLDDVNLSDNDMLKLSRKG